MTLYSCVFYGFEFKKINNNNFTANTVASWYTTTSPSHGQHMGRDGRFTRPAPSPLQQQDQYLFSQGCSHQSSEVRFISPGGLQIVGFHSLPPPPLERHRQAESRRQQKPRRLASGLCHMECRVGGGGKN